MALLFSTSLQSEKKVDVHQYCQQENQQRPIELYD